jgi:hypothetical protein
MPDTGFRHDLAHGHGAPPRAVAIAETWAGVNVERKPMPPALPVMAVWMRTALAPTLVDEARGAWHEAQLEA